MRSPLDPNEHADGRSVEATVLWSELRGVVPASTGVEPREVVAELNAYLDGMVAAVEAHGGTVDSFRGGSLAASFGAWDEGADHAARACACASDMLVRLEQCNQARAGRGHLPLELGIGIATGDAIIGNVGPDGGRRPAVIGEPTNLAARLEGASGRLGTPIVVSRQTAALLEPVDVRTLGWAEVRGVAEPVQVATLAWLDGHSDADEVEGA